MAESLLERCRELTRASRRSGPEPVDFNRIAQVISAILDCSLYIVGRRGHIIGYAFREGQEQFPDIHLVKEYAERFPESFNQEFLRLHETRDNLRIDGDCIFNIRGVSCSCQDKIFTMVPIIGGTWRIGTLILYRNIPEFSEEDIILAEYSALVIANEVLQMRANRVEDDARKKASVKVAVDTLSYSEKEAIRHVLSELSAREGLLVASKIADRMGITRSVIASALRKFESAGIIESRSLGMKGTYIKILDDDLLEEINK